MSIDKNTFCAGPWFQINTGELGYFKPCCDINIKKSKFEGKKYFKWPEDTPESFFNSNYIKYLRENLNKGNKISECSGCWKAEKSGAKSLRQKLNDDAAKNKGHDIENTWINLYFKKKHNLESSLVLSIDAYTSGVCNFGCIMCCAGSSSKIFTQWKKDRHHDVVKDLLSNFDDNYLENIDFYNKSNSNRDLLEKLLNLNPKKAKFYGGEPLIDSKLISCLVNMPKQAKEKMDILFVTNGSRSLIEKTNQLHDFKGVFFTISLDAIENQLEYIRKSSNWKDISDNILEYKKKFPEKHVTVNCVVQALNIYYVDELIQWTEENNLSLTFIELNEPEYMAISAVPTEIKNEAINKLNKLEKISNNNNGNIAFLKELINDSTYNEDHTKKLKNYLSWSDTKGEWEEIFPEWKPFLKNI